MAVWDLGENLPQGRVNVQPNNINTNLIGGCLYCSNLFPLSTLQVFLKPCKQSKLSQ